MAPRFKLDPANAGMHSQDEESWERLDQRRFIMKSDYFATYAATGDTLLPQDSNHVAPELNLSTKKTLDPLPEETILSDRQMVQLFVNTYFSDFHTITKKYVGTKFDNNFSKNGFPRIDNASAGEGAFARYDGSIYVVCILGYRVCPGNLAEQLNVSIRVPWWNKEKGMKHNAPLLSLVGPITLPEGSNPRLMDNLPDWAFLRWMDIDREPGSKEADARLAATDEDDFSRPAKKPKQDHSKRRLNEKGIGFALQSGSNTSSSSPTQPAPEPTVTGTPYPSHQSNYFKPANRPDPRASADRAPKQAVKDDEMDLDDRAPPPNRSPGRRTSPDEPKASVREPNVPGLNIGANLTPEDGPVNFSTENLSSSEKERLRHVIRSLAPPIQAIVDRIPPNFHERILKPFHSDDYPPQDLLTQYKLMRTAESRALDALNACVRDGSINYEGNLPIHRDEANTNRPPLSELGLWFFGHRNGSSLTVPFHITRYMVNTSEWQLDVHGSFEPTQLNPKVSKMQWDVALAADRRRLVYESMSRRTMGLYNPMNNTVEYHIQPYV